MMHVCGYVLLLAMLAQVAYMTSKIASSNHATNVPHEHRSKPSTNIRKAARMSTKNKDSRSSHVISRNESNTHKTTDAKREGMSFWTPAVGG